MLYFTTSWDDGHVLDRKLAELLDRHGVRGTFYVSQSYPDIGELLSEEDIRELSVRHEVGAHTLTHPNLTTLEGRVRNEEILGSKQWLERVTDKVVPLFCYPSGLYTEEVRRAVLDAGFLGARTTQWPSVYLPATPFEMATTLPVYPLPFRKLAGGRLWWRKLLQPLFERYARYRVLGVPWWRMSSWQSAARAALDHACIHGTSFHLWGHSWELENYGMWGELELFLAYAASKSEVTFVTNSELLEIAKKQVRMLGDDSYGSWAFSPVGINARSTI